MGYEQVVFACQAAKKVAVDILTNFFVYTYIDIYLYVSYYI